MYALTDTQIAKLKDLDLMRVCIHEAAHTMMAYHLGYDASWTVKYRGGDAAQQTLYTGQCYTEAIYLGDDYDRCLIGLAGEVATQMYEDPDITADEIMEALEEIIEEGDVSATDLKMIGEYDTFRVMTCMDKLQEVWDELVKFAEEGRDKQLQKEAA